MQLKLQKSDTVEAHARRILGATEVIIRESTNKDFKGITIRTAKGAFDFALSNYGSEVLVACTVPAEIFIARFQAFGTDIEKRFDTEDKRKDFIETLPDEQKESVKLETIQEG
jgi:hypothetical protein